MHRITILLSSLLVSALLIGACAAPAAAPGGESAAAGSGDKAKVTVFVGMGTGTDPDQIQAQEDLAAKYNSSHDDIEMEFLIVPVEEAGERFLAMMSGGNPPQLVGPNGVSTVAQFFDSWGDVAPLIEAEGFDTSDFYGPAVELNQYPDKTVGLPLGLFPSFTFYNKDMFDAAGLEYPTHDFADASWNLDKLRELAMELTLDANGNNATSPDFDPENIVQWGWDDSWTDARGFLTRFGAPNVGRPATEDYRTAVANAEEWVYGLDWLSKAVWEDHFVPDASVQEARDAAGIDPFGSNQVAMFNSHTWFMSEGLVDLPFAYDFAPTPYNQQGGRIARIHADTFTIPKNASNQEAAWEVLKWLTAPEQIVEVCLIYGCIPARRSVADEFQQRLAEKYPDADLSIVFDSIDYLDNPNHESFVPEWGRVNDTMNNNFSAVYLGPVDAQAVLDQTNQELQQLFDDYWAKQ
ncbi:MAG TPA: extracellular solute-binding protein [Caldilinea sp.]|nr:extracellular solute-binding protein [Anaerolineales bacterium]HRA64690.1 extracellular solute-binding protein [Caldilinea sp.]